MNKGEGNFWMGLAAGALLGKKRSGQDSNNGGCFSSVLGLALIVFAVVLGVNFGFKGHAD